MRLIAAYLPTTTVIDPLRLTKQYQAGFADGQRRKGSDRYDGPVTRSKVRSR